MSLGRAVALAVCVLTAPVLAHAGKDKEAEAAMSEYLLGNRDYDISDFGKALVHYKEAYRIKPDAAFLWNIGQCYRKLDIPNEAITMYESYLRNTRDEPATKDQREKAQRFIDELRKKSEEPDRGQEAAASPQPPLVARTPGPSRKTVITGVLTVATFATAAGFGIAAMSRYHTLNESTCMDMCTDDQIAGVRSLATAANVLYAVSAVGAVATGIMVAVDLTAHEGGGISVAWRF